MITKHQVKALEREFPEGIPAWMLTGGHSADQIRELMTLRRAGPARSAEGQAPEHNFSVEPEQWDDAVVMNAAYFQIVIGRNPVTRERMQCKDLPEAVNLARVLLHTVAGQRPMIYAVTATGRSTMLVPQRWEHYLKLWEKHHGTAKVSG